MNATPRSRIISLTASLGVLLAACGGTTLPSTDLAAAPVDDAETTTEPNAGDATPSPVAPAAPDEAGAEPYDTEDTPQPAPSDAPEPEEDVRVVPVETDVDCSAQGRTITITPAPGLPDEVLALREFLIDAALRCDEQRLVTAMEESDAFSFTFGTETDALGMWWDLEAAGEEPFLRLAEVLATTPSVAASGEVVVWPRVTTGRPEDTTTAAWADLHWLDDPQGIAATGDGYLGWRAGISTDGQWRFFVIGD